MWRARRAWSLWRRRLLLCLATSRRRLLPQAAWPQWRLACQLSNSACPPTLNPRFALNGHAFAVACCVFYPDGSTILYCCAFSPDGRSICSGSWDESLKLWDAATGKRQRTTKGQTDCIKCCAYNADGATVLSGSDKLWSVATGDASARSTFNGHSGWFAACRFSPAYGVILSGSSDTTFTL